MSDFDSLLAEADTEVMAAFGTPATYTPSGGVAAPCSAILDRDIQALSPDGMVEGRQIHISCNSSLQPGRGGVFVMDGVSYVVHDILEDDGFNARLLVAKQ
ncbi:MAG: hypothetical protein V7629_17080 [Motiliproteus sp.]